MTNKLRQLLSVGVGILMCPCCFSQAVIPTLDISSQKYRQSLVAAGTEEIYQGHPTTALLSDDKTILCVWTINHGGYCGPMAKSVDGGKTWEMVETPEDWEGMKNCPSIYRMIDKEGTERLMVYAAQPDMAQTYSLDNGETWTPVKSLGIENIMPFTSMVRLHNGDYLAMYNKRPESATKAFSNEVWQSVSKDGGLTWEEPRQIVPYTEAYSPCEPCVFWSPDGKQLACLIRDNNRQGNSLMIFSEDEGSTWTEPQETPWGLTGDRHVAKYAPDGRLVVVFRDKAPLSPTYDHFVAWVGHYSDLLNDKGGEYRIKLLHSYAGWDCGYPGLELLPDGTFVATTYIKYENNANKNSVVSVRFSLPEVDKLLRDPE